MKSLLLAILIPFSARAQVAPYTFSDPQMYARTGDASPTNLTHDLWVWWKLDDGAGGTALDSADTKGGTLNGATAWTAASKIGPFAVSMSGTAPDNCFVGQGTITTPPTNGTIAWWGYPTTAWNSGGTRGVWGWFNDATHEWDCQVFSNNKWYIGGVNSGDTRLTVDADPANWPANTWCHYAFAWSPSGQRFYTNGVLCAFTLTDSGTNTISGDYFHFGKLGQNSFWFAGKLDEFRLYTNALSSAEISYLYHTVYGQ